MFNEVHKLIADVAPEIVDRGYYLLHAADSPARSDECLAWSLPGYEYNHQFAQHMRSRGEWRGCLPAIVLNSGRISWHYQMHAYRPCLLAIALHELAHVLPVGEPAEEHSFKLSEPAKQLADAVAYEHVHNRPATLFPWVSDSWHGWRFIRRALHLWARASKVGFRIPLSGLVCAGDSLSWPTHYDLALGSEPDDMSGCTFEEIEDQSPPFEFLELWTRDVEQYQHAQKS